MTENQAVNKDQKRDINPDMVCKIYKWDEIKPEEILRRGHSPDEDENINNIREQVARIIKNVRTRGDDALREYTRRFDGVEIDDFRVTPEEMETAYDSLGEEFQEVLLQASANIEKFHEKQIRNDYVITDTPGIVTGLRFTPIERVGICIPASPTAFPSSILMNAIPARMAGVKEIVLVTPPDKTGKINAAALGAAYIAAEKIKIYKIGGAQAVAALAYGTESIPAVDKIVGPGGVFVSEAKKQVSGHVGIDIIAGPSEILVIADQYSNPAYVAADLLSQAEHDIHATAVLITDQYAMAQSVQGELALQIKLLPRYEIAAKALKTNGKLIVAKNLNQAIEIANQIAPEHLELCVENPFDMLSRVRNAGSVFLGRHAPEALGDYFAGPNHTLPTSGTARFSGPLSVDDFVKKSSFIYYAPQAFESVADSIASFAEREGLHAHARSVLIRKTPEAEGNREDEKNE